MLDPEAFVIFVTASVVALAIPGPTIALVVTRSLSNGRQISVPLCLGVGAGTLVGSSVALSGAGAVLAASATAFTVLKWLGAAYLIYLGLKLIGTQPTSPQNGGPSDKASALEGLRDGFLITLLNPKSLAFSAAFIPQFIGTHASYFSQAALLVATFTVLATVNALVFALGTDALRRMIWRLDLLRWVNRIGGGLLFASGVAGLFLKRPTA